MGDFVNVIVFEGMCQDDGISRTWNYLKGIVIAWESIKILGTHGPPTCRDRQRARLIAI
jgi:hypothetical protein